MPRDPNEPIVLYVTLRIFGRVTRARLRKLEERFNEFAKLYIEQSRRVYVSDDPRLNKSLFGIYNAYTMQVEFCPCNLKAGLETYQLLGKATTFFPNSPDLGYIK